MAIVGNSFDSLQQTNNSNAAGWRDLLLRQSGMEQQADLEQQRQAQNAAQFQEELRQRALERAAQQGINNQYLTLAQQQAKQNQAQQAWQQQFETTSHEDLLNQQGMSNALAWNQHDISEQGRIVNNALALIKSHLLTDDAVNKLPVPDDTKMMLKGALAQENAAAERERQIGLSYSALQNAVPEQNDLVSDIANLKPSLWNRATTALSPWTTSFAPRWAEAFAKVYGMDFAPPEISSGAEGLDAWEKLQKRAQEKSALMKMAQEELMKQKLPLSSMMWNQGAGGFAPAPQWSSSMNPRTTQATNNIGPIVRKTQRNPDTGRLEYVTQLNPSTNSLVNP
jgi:hypothetical protein